MLPLCSVRQFLSVQNLPEATLTSRGLAVHTAMICFPELPEHVLHARNCFFSFSITSLKLLVNVKLQIQLE